MKVAPVFRALGAKQSVSQNLVHTGQHYDSNMSAIFFDELGIPEPEVNLKVGSGSHAQQTAAIISRFEPVLLEYEPDLVLVYGDVNSTVATSLVCAKLRVPIGHVEAGLRSHDLSMPEEVNRILTDRVADLLFTPSCDADENLRREGVPNERIYCVGNVMIDTLMRFLPKAEERFQQLAERFELLEYGLVTLHRPSNVDDLEWIGSMLQTLEAISRDIPLLFPIHPRTRNRLGPVANFSHHRLRLLEPLSYLDFIALEAKAKLVITDSGGIQEETTWFKVPCLTVRENTERPVTLSMGTNSLVGRDLKRLRLEVTKILDSGAKKGQVPPLWDGKSGERIADVIASLAYSRETSTKAVAASSL